MTDRITQLKEFIRADPSDTFSRYALALEYMKSDPATALTQLEELMALKPDYLPSYYPAAHLLIDARREDEAERVFLKGIELAQKQSNQKTELELKSALSVWKLERE